MAFEFAAVSKVLLATMVVCALVFTAWIERD